MMETALRQMRPVTLMRSLPAARVRSYNVESCIKAIDGQIIRKIEFQNNLLREHNETLNQKISE